MIMAVVVGGGSCVCLPSQGFTIIVWVWVNRSGEVDRYQDKCLHIHTYIHIYKEMSIGRIMNIDI